MIGCESGLEPVVIDHVRYRADGEVEGDGYNECYKTGAKILVEEGVIRS